MTEDEYMRWREENAVKLEPGDSLFDQHSEDSLALNLEYMSITHGFFVPFVDQCCDVVCVHIYTRIHACMNACIHIYMRRIYNIHTCMHQEWRVKYLGRKVSIGCVSINPKP